MKLSFATTLFWVGVCHAFMPSISQIRQSVMMKASTNANDKSSSYVTSTSRREAIGNAFHSLALVGMTAAITAASPVFAKEKFEYLDKPTEEFEELQKKAMAFEKVAYEKKQVWKGRYTKLEKAKTEAELVAALDDLTKFVLEEKGLPIGLKKQALVTDIRKIKRAGKDAKIWNKDAEISYEQLIYSVNYQQSPNTARDLANPL